MKLSSITILTALAIPAVAHADEPAAASEVAPRELRRGFHLGFSVGGAYLPVNDGVSVGVVRLDLNMGGRRFDRRLSAIAYRSSANETTGLGLTYEEWLPIGSTFSIGGGVLVATESTDQGSTSAFGLTFSPITLRLGARRNYELGLALLWVREPDLDNQTGGGYISFSYVRL